MLTQGGYNLITVLPLFFDHKLVVNYQTSWLLLLLKLLWTINMPWVWWLRWLHKCNRTYHTKIYTNLRCATSIHRDTHQRHTNPRQHLIHSRKLRDNYASWDDTVEISSLVPATTVVCLVTYPELPFKLLWARSAGGCQLAPSTTHMGKTVRYTALVTFYELMDVLVCLSALDSQFQKHITDAGPLMLMVPC